MPIIKTVKIQFRDIVSISDRYNGIQHRYRLLICVSDIVSKIYLIANKLSDRVLVVGYSYSGHVSIFSNEFDMPDNVELYNMKGEIISLDEFYNKLKTKFPQMF